MKEYYSAKELAGLPGMPGTERGIQKKAQTEQWRFQKMPAPGGPGGKRREYHISALPDDTRAALLAQGAGLPADTVSDPDVLKEHLASRRISLSPAELADPIMQAKLACSRAYESCPAYQGREKVLAALASKYNKSIPTIRRWVDDIATRRTRPTPRITLGEERIDIPESYTFSREALAYGLATYANNIRSGMKAAYNQMQTAAAPKQWTIGDYSSFTRIVKKIPSAVWVRIRRGATGFELACVPKIVREWTAIPVQSVLCGDQKIFDYEIYDPALSRILIPNGYFWMDCASRMINGVWIEMGHYNSHTVGNALREALRYGIPDEIFTDWGKPEGSKHIIGILDALSGHSRTGNFSTMAERYGDMTADDVEHRKAQPGKPWMKPIENIMNILDTRLAAKFIGGFRKRNNDAWVNKVVQAQLKQDRKLTRTILPWRPATPAEARGLMTIEEFVHTVFAVVEEHNRAEKKLQEGGTIIPGQFFAAGMARQHRPVLDEPTLNYICLPQFIRTPHQSVVKVTVRHDDERGYYSHVLANRKDRVRISVDPYNREAPAVLTNLDGTFLDLAQPWHVQNPYDREGLQTKRSRQAELMQWVGAQARRIREAFGIVIEDAAPAAARSPLTKIVPASAVAHEAEKEHRVYQIRKENTQLNERETAREANTLRADLQARFAAQAAAQAAAPAPFMLPPEGKERYVAYLALAERADAGDELSPEEEAFLQQYPNTADYRHIKRLHEKFGDLYIPTGKEDQAAGGRVIDITQQT